MRGLGLAAALEASGASVCLSHARYDMTRAHAIAFAFAFAFAVAWAWHPVMSCPRSFSSGIGFALCLTHGARNFSHRGPRFRILRPPSLSLSLPLAQPLV